MILPFEICPGALLWKSRLSKEEQSLLLSEVTARLTKAPFFGPSMPRTGKPFSVEMSNFGTLGWVSDKKNGYRYEPCHPVTGNAWPDIPPSLLQLWGQLASYPAGPEACLVNLYRAKARMGLHQDRDEEALDAPVLSVSLGDDAQFRIGGAKRGDPTSTVVLSSGDVLLFGGPARLCRHGVDRIRAGSRGIIPGGGRINLTLRRVRAAEK